MSAILNCVRYYSEGAVPLECQNKEGNLCKWKCGVTFTCAMLELISIISSFSSVIFFIHSKSNTDLTSLASATFCVALSVVCFKASSISLCILRKGLKNFTGETLMWAVQNKRSNIVRLLIGIQANVEFRDTEFNTPLILAACAADREITQILIRAKANLDVKKHFISVLAEVVKKKHQDIARLLIREKANVDTLDDNNETPLLRAIQTGQCELAQALIEASPLEPLNRIKYLNAQSLKGRTALICAFKEKHESIARLLITAQADVNLKDAENNSLLLIAAETGQFETTRVLIQAKAHLNVRGKNLHTALTFAINNKHQDIVRLLIREKANIDTLDANSETPLLRTLQTGQCELAQALIEASPLEPWNRKKYLDAQNINGNTALICAIQEKYEPIACLLIDSKAKIDITIDDEPLLFKALETEQLDVAQTLIKAKANLNVVKNSGNNLYDIIEKINKNGSIFSVLKEVLFHHDQPDISRMIKITKNNENKEWIIKTYSEKINVKQLPGCINTIILGYIIES